MMRSYDSILSQHEDLRGHTITHAGWDELATYLKDRPNHQAINEFFTPEAERYVNSNFDELAKPIEDTAALFIALSNPASAALDSGLVELDPSAQSLGMHVDALEGDVYLGNFNVLNNPSYIVYPHVTPDFRTFTDEWGVTSLVKVDETRPERITIASRQLVILTARCVSARLEHFKDIQSSIPHAVEVKPEDSRTLFMSHAVDPAITERLSPQDRVLISA